MTKKLIIILLAVFTGTSMKSQAPECFFVHFDKSFYVSGETIWFKVYNLDTVNHAQSSVLHIDLIDHNNQLVARQKLPLQSGSAHGSIFIPFEAEEGYYRFRAFTRYNLNFSPPAVYQATLPVYQLDKLSIADSLMNVETSTEPSGMNGITVISEKNMYQTRDSGERVTSRLLSIYVDKTSQLIRASSQNGRIRVSVPDYWGSGVFQILNLDPYNPSVLQLIQGSEWEAEDPYFNPTPPQRTPRVLNYLNQTLKRRKIIELFDLYPIQEINRATPQQKIPDAIYRTEDFKQIYSLEQFINEAIPNVRVRMINSLNTIRLFNRDRGKLFEDHPWYLVDGFLTFNEQEVLKIPYQDINEVRIYSRSSTVEQFFHGFMLRSGVMEIITREVKYVRELKNSPNVVEIEGFAEPQDFNHTFILPESKTTPDLRGVLYWDPNVTTDSTGQGQITIPLSDDTGKFAVVMMGTNELGRPISGYCTFEIKMK